MDFVFHAVLGLVVSKAVTDGYMLSAAVASTMPDLLGLSYYQWVKAKHSNKTSIVGFVKSFKDHTDSKDLWKEGDLKLYFFFHSVLIWLGFTVISLIFLRDYWIVFSLSYLSHLFVDSYTHVGKFAPMPFYPFSKWRLRLIHSESTILTSYIINWVAIMVVIILQLS